MRQIKNFQEYKALVAKSDYVILYCVWSAELEDDLIAGTKRLCSRIQEMQGPDSRGVDVGVVCCETADDALQDIADEKEKVSGLHTPLVEIVLGGKRVIFDEDYVIESQDDVLRQLEKIVRQRDSFSERKEGGLNIQDAKDAIAQDVNNFIALVREKTNGTREEKTNGTREGNGAIKFWSVLGFMLFLGLLFGDHETQKQQQSSSKSDNSCISDWRQCETNSALVNDYAHISSIIRECESKAEEMAKYGEPEFPWGSFSTYLQGADYIKDGKLVLIEEDAQFENGFGATVNTSVRCTYDLRTEEVVGMDID